MSGLAVIHLKPNGLLDHIEIDGVVVPDVSHYSFDGRTLTLDLDAKVAIRRNGSFVLRPDEIAMSVPPEVDDLIEGFKSVNDFPSTEELVS